MLGLSQRETIYHHHLSQLPEEEHFGDNHVSGAEFHDFICGSDSYEDEWRLVLV